MAASKTSTVNLILSTRRTNVPLCKWSTVHSVLFFHTGFGRDFWGVGDGGGGGGGFMSCTNTNAQKRVILPLELKCEPEKMIIPTGGR